MDEVIEQRICLKFCKANQISYETSLEMLEKVYGNSLVTNSKAEEDWCGVIKDDTILATDKNIEQRICLKFCVANKISCAASLRMLEKCYNNSVISKTQAYEWYRAFKDGRQVVQDMPRSGRPSTSATNENIQRVKKLLNKKPNASVRKMAEKLHISRESVRLILVDTLGIKLSKTKTMKNKKIKIKSNS